MTKREYLYIDVILIKLFKLDIYTQVQSEMKGVTFQILNTSIEITFYVTTLHKWVFDWNAQSISLIQLRVNGCQAMSMISELIQEYSS